LKKFRGLFFHRQKLPISADYTDSRDQHLPYPASIISSLPVAKRLASDSRYKIPATTSMAEPRRPHLQLAVSI
jgi:hypothetical protein